MLKSSMLALALTAALATGAFAAVRQHAPGNDQRVTFNPPQWPDNDYNSTFLPPPSGDNQLFDRAKGSID